MGQTTESGTSDADQDMAMMGEAMAAAASARTDASPNPWVGCVIVPAGDAPASIGATQMPGGPHAEAVALALAGPTARDAVAYVTLEPCSHQGRTPPCADALVAAGVRRVVVGILDPDPHVHGGGVERLRSAGIGVTVGVCAGAIAEQLAPYLKHRITGRPWVIVKLATSLDGRIAAPDGTSRWITGPLARADAHRLRAESDAVVVGAGTVRTDDPALTVRDADGRDPLRVVLGHAPVGARVHPALEMSGDPGQVLDDLGRRGVLQVLVEGGATVAHEFHAARLVDRYVLYLAPALFGGDDGRAMFAGPGSASIDDLWRGRIVSVARLGPDLRIELAPVATADDRPSGRLGSGPVFTGIVEELGRLRSRDGSRFVFEAPVVTSDAKVGDSIAVNGCCLTVVDVAADTWAADVVDETLSRTNLAFLDPGDPVNLERSARLADRVGGHLVQGHVDAVGEVVTAAPDLRVRAPTALLRYIVEKGSIAVDGCSLTVVAPLDDGFTVAVIPHSAAVTTLGLKGPGARVNLEVDLFAKYAERLLAERGERS